MGKDKAMRLAVKALREVEQDCCLSVKPSERGTGCNAYNALVALRIALKRKKAVTR